MPTAKLICNWCSSEEISRGWGRQSQGDGRWEDLQLISDGKKADYFVIINFPPKEEQFDPRRTIIFPMEPRHNRRDWRDWRDPDPRRFLRVMSHDRHYNNIVWQLSKTYLELINEPPIEKTRQLSSVTSDLADSDGQRRRIEFLRVLETTDLKYDLFGRGNKFQLANYRGPLPPRDKGGGLLPYCYTFAAENCQEHNYFTEKLTDAILAECLCFYWGCPNVGDYIDSRAFIPIDIYSPDEAIGIMRRAMAGNEWERRIEFIRAGKKRILDQLQFFPRLLGLLRNRIPS